MAFTVFFAWQSDRPNNLCRGLIRHALDEAASQLNEQLNIEDADREVQIDQDTQGVAGSPPITDTILEKIRNCDAFVSDLTFIPTGDGLRTTPNPNVLVEYGYALHAKSDQRIIGVFNDAFGAPVDLPFDLRHKRWPFQFHAPDNGDSDEAQTSRRAARQQLARMLTGAIEAIIDRFASVDIDTPGPQEIEAPAGGSEPQVVADRPGSPVPSTARASLVPYRWSVPYMVFFDGPR